MIFVDTGYLLALVIPRDQWNARAKAWSAVVTEPLIVTDYVLWEVVNALSQPKNRPKAHAIIDRLQGMAQCEIIAAGTGLFQSGLELHRARGDKSWSLTDCISFGVMS